jgi:hypothetical protein
MWRRRRYHRARRKGLAIGTGFHTVQVLRCESKKEKSKATLF